MYCLCFLFTIFTFLRCLESSFLILVTSFSTSSTSLCQSPGQYIYQHWRVVTSPQKGIYVLYIKIYQIYICIYMYLLIPEVLRIDVYLYIYISYINIYICLFLCIYINTLHFKTSMSFQSIERFVDEAWNWDLYLCHDNFNTLSCTSAPTHATQTSRIDTRIYFQCQSVKEQSLNPGPAALGHCLGSSSWNA